MRNSVKVRINEIANQLRSELIPHDKAKRTLFRRLVRSPAITFYAYAQADEPPPPANPKMVVGHVGKEQSA
jgi:hypothetical protein